MRTRKFVTRLGAELTFSELGFGGAPLGNLYRPLTEKEARTTLETVWATGCRYFDTAPLYGLGLSETRLNGFLRPKPRHSYLLSTKVGRLLEVCKPQERSRPNAFFETPSRRERFDYSYDGVLRSLEQSLERLGLDSIDIVFAHDVDLTTHGCSEAVECRLAEFMNGGYRALDELRAAGVVKAIGAGVNECEAAEAFARAGDFDVFMIAGRYTLLEQDALTNFLPMCRQMGIGVVVGGPFNSGILATGVKSDAHYNYRPPPDAVKARVRRIQTVCRDHNVRLPEAALHFPLGHPAVLSVVPGVARASEARRNAAMMAKKIPPALWRALKGEGLLREDAPCPR
ncbi:aldo/keto reductase [Roseiarcus fermentans]|uniref:aldo/keto reductase n=1 Tax=Roseiarcus fermentans TaxID=1473586 RepID=UPI000DE81771|nr:aldo/keto reductase [Roseiarcus fermentans]